MPTKHRYLKKNCNGKNNTYNVNTAFTEMSYKNLKNTNFLRNNILQDNYFYSQIQHFKITIIVIIYEKTKKNCDNV